MTWWRKPLLRFSRKILPAELVVLARELSGNEAGAWINSRGTTSGCVDLVRVGPRKFKTKRIPLPGFVSARLRRLYRTSRVKKGCPDLVIWNPKSARMRLVEVKCPHWDRPSKEQEIFLASARKTGIAAKIVEWEFR